MVATFALVVMAACSGGGGGSGSSSPGSNGGNKNAPPLQFSMCCWWQTTWSYNPWTSYFPGFANGFVYQRLAKIQFPSLTEFKGRLADKWSIDGQKITVHIRDGQKWDDGTPVTTKDVMTTLILQGLNGDNLFNDISDMNAKDDSTFTVTVRKGVPPETALSDLLQQYIRPDSVYGKYATPEMKKAVFSYYDEFQKDPSKAAKSSAKKKMDAQFDKLSKLKPKKMVGDGPFKLITMNTQKAKLVKSETYVDADKIKVEKMDAVSADNQQLYGFLTSRRVDFSNVYLPGPIAKKLSKAKDYKVGLPPAFSFAMVFNSNNGPTAKVEVRQAIAYIIDRKAMIKAAYGTVNPGGKVEMHPSGLEPATAEQFLTQDQINQLNSYPVDHDKATQLLQKAGYTKSGKTWVDSSGKPLTLKMETNSGTTDITTAFQTAASELTDFGIKTTVTTVPGAKQSADLHSGNFQITQSFPGGANPLSAFQGQLGRVQNFTTSGVHKGGDGIGFGPKAKVPGLGVVNVPNTIDKQSVSVPPGPKMKKLAWDWARLVNQQLPYLQYGNKIYQFSFYTTHYGNWPPPDSPLWPMIGDDTNGGIVQAMLQGYIVPK